MEYRTLDITVMSAKDLSDINLFSKMDVYTYVSISGDPKSKQKTPVDTVGGKNPTWDYTVKFKINVAAAKQNHMIVVFQLKDRQVLGDKDIGEVHVPVEELLENVDKPVQFVSYQISKPSGRAKGQLNISYKFWEKVTTVAVMPTYAALMPTYTVVPEPYKVNNEPTAAYPAQAAVGASSSGYQQGYPQPLGAEYGYPAQPSPHYGAYPLPPQPGYSGYPPPQPGYGYPSAPQQPGYGYPPPLQPGYGYPPGQQPYGKENKKKKKNGMGGMVFGVGLLVGEIAEMQMKNNNNNNNNNNKKKNGIGGMAFGAGLLVGAIAGMLIESSVSDAADFKF